MNKPWFKCLNPKSEIMRKAKKAVGNAGLWEISLVVDEAMDQGVTELDWEMVSSFAEVRKDRALKLLALAQEVLEYFRKLTQKISRSSQNISRSSQEVLRTSQDLTPSNPVPDRPLIEDNRKNRLEKIPPTPKGGKGVSEPTEFSKNGLTLIQKSNNANMQNMGWVTGYLDGVRGQYQDKSDDVLLSIWLEVCTSASANGIGSSQWYMKAFQNKVAVWKPHSPLKQQTGLTLGRPAIVPHTERKGGVLEI